MELSSINHLFSETSKKRLEEEELEVYGTGQKTSVQLTNFTFEVIIVPTLFFCTLCFSALTRFDLNDLTPKIY